MNTWEKIRNNFSITQLLQHHLDPVDEIKSRLDIYDVVSQYVQLKKAGKNFKGLCPFHQEKTPSFIVSPDKGICYCFGCKQGGDVFEFIKAIERVDFKEAVELLADKIGITVSKMPGYQHRKEQKDAIKNIYRVVTDFYGQNLKKDQKIMAYLKERGISDDSITTFQLGYAPNSYETTYQYLLKQKFTRKDIVEAGLAVQKGINDNQIYDRFRKRVMIPLYNTQGNVIAFTGRIFGEGEPKYLNSPESVLFKKGQFFYGLHSAKEAIRKQDEVIIMEGNMDVIRSYQAGVCNVVASSGTALTRDQIQMIKRYTTNLIFCFDADTAGFEATKRAIVEAMPFDVNLYLLSFPKDIKDPDEFIDKRGDQAWLDHIQTKEYYLDYLIRIAYAKWDYHDVQGKKAICDFLFPFLNKVPSSVEREHYVRICAEKMKTEPQHILQDLKAHKGLRNKPKRESNSKITVVRYSPEEYLLGLIVNYPEYFENVDDAIKSEAYLDTKIERFYNHIKTMYNQGENLEFCNVISYFDREDKEYLSILCMFIEEQYKDIGKDVVKIELEKITTKLHVLHLKKQLKLTKDPAVLQSTLQELNSIVK